MDEDESLADLLVKFNLSESKSEARKLIKAGAISFNGQKIMDENFKTEDRGVLRRGKNKFAVVE